MERLSEQLKHCLDGNGCVICKNFEEKSVLTCRSLLYAAYEKIKEYEDLEEQGKLLKLPCKVGDTVYHLCTLKNGKSEIIEIKVGCVESYGAIRNHNGMYEVWNVYAETDYTKEYFKFFDFGKTVFLTREEAKAALKEL